MVARPDDLRAAFSLVPEFLRTPDAEDALSLSEYGPALGRRFRALKLWAVLRCYGALRACRSTSAAASSWRGAFEQWVADEPGWELCAPRWFSLVCFRLDGDDERNRRCWSASTPPARCSSPTRCWPGATCCGWRSGS